MVCEFQFFLIEYLAFKIQIVSHLILLELIGET